MAYMGSRDPARRIASRAPRRHARCRTSPSGTWPRASERLTAVFSFTEHDWHGPLRARRHPMCPGSVWITLDASDDLHRAFLGRADRQAWRAIRVPLEPLPPAKSFRDYGGLHKRDTRCDQRDRGRERSHIGIRLRTRVHNTGVE